MAKARANWDRLVNPAKAIAERLKAARKRLDLTQAKLAGKARLGRSALIHYEQGHAVPGGLELELVKLANALKLTPNFILSGSDEFFTSKSPAHVLAGDIGQGLPVARTAICLTVLSREMQETLSSLIMGSVKAKLTKREFEGLIKSIDALESMGPELKPLLNAFAAKAGPRLLSKQRKRK